MPEELGTYDMVLPQHTNYLLKRGEDKMTWGEKVLGNNKRAIIKYIGYHTNNLTLAG